MRVKARCTLAIIGHFFYGLRGQQCFNDYVKLVMELGALQNIDRGEERDRRECSYNVVNVVLLNSQPNFRNSDAQQIIGA